MSQSYTVDCDKFTKNTGLNKLCPDISTIAGYIICPYNYSIATLQEALQASTWEAAIQAEKADRIYPFPPVFNFEDESEELVLQEGTTSTIFVREGKIRFKMQHSSGRYKHEALRSHNLQDVSVYFIDQNNRIQGTTKDGVTFDAQNLEQFIVDKLQINNGTEGTITTVTMVFADSGKWQDKPAVLDTREANFNPLSLEGLTDVYLAETGVSTGSAVRIEAEVWHSGIKVNGLSETVGEDFIVKDAATGAVQTVTTIADEGEGVYLFSFSTALTTGTYTFDLVPSDTMVTKGYEAREPATVIIS